jgi:hypothetical protein
LEYAGGDQKNNVFEVESEIIPEPEDPPMVGLHDGDENRTITKDEDDDNDDDLGLEYAG